MSSYAALRAARERPERVVTLIPKKTLKLVDEWGVATGLPNRSEVIRALLEKGLKAAGAEFGDQSPAAGKAHQEANQPEASSHAAE